MTLSFLDVEIPFHGSFRCGKVINYCSYPRATLIPVAYIMTVQTHCQHSDAVRLQLLVNSSSTTFFFTQTAIPELVQKNSALYSVGHTWIHTTCIATIHPRLQEYDVLRGGNCKQRVATTGWLFVGQLSSLRENISTQKICVFRSSINANIAN